MKNKYIIFTSHGARIVKGYSLGGIPVPKELPTHIPMKYWKHEKGCIIEMSSKEKKKIDKALKKQLKARPRHKLRFIQYVQIVIISLLCALLVSKLSKHFEISLINNYLKGISCQISKKLNKEIICPNQF